MERVRHNAEFQRISALPRDDYHAIGAACHAEIQGALRTRHGTMVLKPWQAAALAYVVEHGGLFTSAGVGAGKTIVSLLIPVIVLAKRPLLLLPAAAREKTYAEIPEYRRHFKLHPYLQILAYEELSRLSGVNALYTMEPDWIVADEAHKLKDLNAARSRRFMRFFEDNPSTRLAAMSGTPTTSSIKDYAHHLRLALPEACPVPMAYHDLEMWAGALDLKPTRLVSSGPLRAWCKPGENLNQAWQRRLGETPGVILTTAASSDARIEFDKATLPVPPDIAKAIKALYDTWATPGGEECQYAMEIWRHGRELSCGFYYRWVWPNGEVNKRWVEARAAWRRFVRDAISDHRGYDSPKAVEVGVVRGDIPDIGRRWEKWEAVRPEYKPVVEPVWLSDFFADAVVAEARRRDALVWVEHAAFGARLERRGLPYHGPKSTQLQINSARGSVGVSQKAHREAKNLQRRCDNIVVSPSASGSEWEQMIGRTHRMGQTSPCVNVTVYQHTAAFRDSLESAMRGARYMQDTTGQKQKLLMGRWK